MYQLMQNLILYRIWILKRFIYLGFPWTVTTKVPDSRGKTVISFEMKVSNFIYLETLNVLNIKFKKIIPYLF